MICVSVGERKWSDAAELASRYSFTEIRLDYFDTINVENVSAVFSSGKGNKIVTYRKTDTVSDNDRITMIKAALDSGASYADADINNDENFINSVSAAVSLSTAKLIISYHNFDETPSLVEIDRIINKASNLGADIIKLACRAESDAEAERLLSIPSERNNIVIAGMGSLGGRIRMLSPFYRSLFTYASPDNGKAVAPGQIPYSELLANQKRYLHEW